MTSVKGESKWLRLGFVAGILVGMYIIYALAVSLWDIREAYGRIGSTNARLRLEQDKRVELISQLQEATDSGYIEEIARNELNMMKPGESMVILPGGGAVSEKQEKAVSGRTTSPNWRKWWNLVK